VSRCSLYGGTVTQKLNDFGGNSMEESEGIFEDLEVVLVIRSSKTDFSDLHKLMLSLRKHIPLLVHQEIVMTRERINITNENSRNLSTIDCTLRTKIK